VWDVAKAVEVEVEAVGSGIASGGTIVGDWDTLARAEVDWEPPGLGYAPNSSVTWGGNGELLLEGAAEIG
jgi:hypothetical protein